MPECEEAFQLLKNHLKSLPLLAKPINYKWECSIYIFEHQSYGCKLHISERRDQGPSHILFCKQGLYSSGNEISQSWEYLYA